MRGPVRRAGKSRRCSRCSERLDRPWPPSTSRSRLGLVQVSLAGILWGTGGLGVQVIREHEPMSVLTISAWRMGLAAVVLLAAVALLRQAGDVVRLLASGPGPRSSPVSRPAPTRRSTSARSSRSASPWRPS